LTLRFVAENADRWPVRWMCAALEVSAPGYYAWACRPDSPTEQWRRELVGAIEPIHAEVKQRYGSPRMTAELKARGYECSENTVADLMRDHGIRAKAPRRFVRTTDSGHRQPVAENLLARDFEPEGPNESWRADITYLPTRGVVPPPPGCGAVGPLGPGEPVRQRPLPAGALGGRDHLQHE
jgi:hypothetical protein